MRASPTLCGLVLLAGCGGGASSDPSDPDGFVRETGSLTGRDVTLVSGEHADEYALDVEAGQWIEVAMTSDAFNPYLIVKPPSCPREQAICESQSDVDDFASGTDAFVWRRADEAGRWTILATSAATGELGDYALAYRAVGADQLPATPGVALAARTERGTLADGDEVLESGELLDRYGFVGNAGDRVSVDLRSAEFDPYLILQMPGNDQEDNDDWEGSGEHSRIEHTLPEDGMYSILVTSYAPGESGAYELIVTPEGRETPAPGDAAEGTNGASDPFAK